MGLRCGLIGSVSSRADLTDQWGDCVCGSLSEKYEAEEQKNKEKELKKRLAASQGRSNGSQSDDENDGEEEEVVGSRRGGRSRESDRRKEALKNLKVNKSKGSGDRARSMLVDRFGDDDDGTGSDGGGGAGRDLAEKRRKRQELQRGSARGRSSRDHDDDDYSDGDAASARRRLKRDDAKPSALLGLPLTLDGGRVDEEDEAKPEENVPVNWNQANHYLLRKRPFFEKYFFEPYFDKLVRGFYVRVPISVVDGEMVYRFCEIVAVCRFPKAYNFAGEATHKGVVCAFGKSRLEWKLNGVSAHSLQEREFLVWRATLNKERLRFPTHAEAKQLSRSKQKLITNHRYTEDEVTVMVGRKSEIGVPTVSLGVQRVRLERDLKAAQDMKNFEKALKLEEKLQRLLAENEARQSRKSDDVLRINEINKRNREANQRQDLQAQELNDAVLEKMTSAERLQFVRANSKKMYLSKAILDKNLADGKLVQLPDGRIMTLNKIHEVEALPDDLVSGKFGVTKDKMGGSSRELDIDKLLDKQRERKLTELRKLEAKRQEEDAKVEIVGGGDDGGNANATIRIHDSDGSWMTLRPASEIVTKMQSKPVVSDATKATRTGITVKEYFDRVKRRRVAE